MYFPKPAINENDLAIIERGDTAEHSIEAGQYVSWKGKLGKAKAAILLGATLDDSLFDYETDGMLNDLNNKIPQQITISNLRTGASVYAYKIGNIIEINVDATGSIPANTWTDIGTIDMSYMPAYNVGCMMPNADVKGFGMLRVEASTGKIRIYHALSGSTTFYGIALTYFAIPTA